MSHEIYASDRFSEVRANGERAWHGLGTELPEGLTAVEAGEHAGILRPMELLPVYAERTVVGADGTPRVERVEIPDRRLQVYSDNLIQTGVVGSDYQQFTNRDLATFAEGLCGLDTALVVETCGTLRHGRQCFFLLRMPTIIGGGDAIKPYIYCTTTHGGAGSISIGASAVRVVCANTDMLAQKDISADGVRVRHSGDLQTKLASARNALSFAQESIREFAKRADAYAARALTRSEFSAFMLQAADAVLPQPEEASDTALTRWRNRRDELLTAWRQIWASRTVAGAGHGNDLWGAYNVLTEWADHGKLRGGVDAETRTHSRLFGAAAARKREFRKLADAVLGGAL